MVTSLFKIDTKTEETYSSFYVAANNIIQVVKIIEKETKFDNETEIINITKTKFDCFIDIIN